MAAGSGVLAVTEADYARPEVGPLMNDWLIGPGIEAKRRLKVMKLAWDMTGTQFGARAGLYGNACILEIRKSMRSGGS